MAQLVTAILSNQGALAAEARKFTGDVNEASLLVGKVMSRAFSTFDRESSADAVARKLRRDLEALIAERKPS
jgi:hypothetical protein